MKSFRCKLIDQDGSEVRTLLSVLVAVKKHGFNTVSPVVKSCGEGTYFSALLKHTGDSLAYGLAFGNLVDEIHGPIECLAA
jgi:uncharacterized lipoprotein YddW (UPF0748 family)